MGDLNSGHSPCSHTYFVKSEHNGITEKISQVWELRQKGFVHLGKCFFICKLLLFHITIFVYLTEYLLYFTGVVFDRMCFGFLRLFCVFNIIFLYVSGSMLCITQNFLCISHIILCVLKNIFCITGKVLWFCVTVWVIRRRAYVFHTTFCASQ